MPFPSGTYLQYLLGLSTQLVSEFNSLYAQFEGYLRNEHKGDGSHAAITADSVTMTGALDVGAGGSFVGNVIAQDEVASGYLGPVEIGNLIAGGRTSSVIGAGIDMGGGTAQSGTTRWAIGLASQISAGTLLFFDASATGGGDEGRALAIMRTSSQPSQGGSLPVAYAWGPPTTPSAASIVGDLGQSSRPWRYGYFTNDVNVSGTTSGYYEKSRAFRMGEWTTYTPALTWSGGGGSNGNGVFSGRYTIIGKTCFYKVFISWGSTQTAGSGQMQISLPVTNQSGNTLSQVFATVSGSFYSAWTRSTTTDILPYSSNYASADAAWTSTVPVSWASGNTITAQGQYEIA